MISVPVMSLGIRSGVNWMRLNLRCSASASVETISVLARPGTPTSRPWPAGEERGQDAVHHLVLADDALGDLVAAAVRRASASRAQEFDVVAHPRKVTRRARARSIGTALRRFSRGLF